MCAAVVSLIHASLMMEWEKLLQDQLVLTLEVTHAVNTSVFINIQPASCKTVERFPVPQMRAPGKAAANTFLPLDRDVGLVVKHVMLY